MFFAYQAVQIGISFDFHGNFPKAVRQANSDWKRSMRGDTRACPHVYVKGLPASPSMGKQAEYIICVLMTIFASIVKNSQ